MNIIDELRRRLPGPMETAHDHYRAQGIAGVDDVANKLLAEVGTVVEVYCGVVHDQRGEGTGN